MCDLVVVNAKKFLALQISSILLILASSLFSTNRPLSIFLSVAGWSIVGYMFYVRYPDKVKVVIPLVIGTALSNVAMLYNIGFVVPYSIFLASLAWYTVEETWALYVVLLLTGAHSLVVWQKSQNLFGVEIEAFIYTMIAAMWSLPTTNEFQDVSCLNKILENVPSLKPYESQIDCVVQSGCFDDLLVTDSTNATLFANKIIKSITCAGEKCDIYKQIATDVDCFTQNCMQTLLQNPPSTPFQWASQILSLYTTCGVPKCKLPPPF